MTEKFWRDWTAKFKHDGPYEADRDALADHAQGADLRADRRHRRGAHHLAAGMDRRRAQLGLPLLLAARRDADAARVHERRLLRGGRGVAANGCCARSPAGPSRRRSCTASPASGGWSNGRCRGCRAFANSAPVRIGNGAHSQLQLDVYRRGDGRPASGAPRRHRSQPTTAGRCRSPSSSISRSAWTEPDESIWEVRSGRRHFTYSKVMAWVAFDRAIKSAEEYRPRRPGRALARAAHA